MDAKKYIEYELARKMMEDDINNPKMIFQKSKLTVLAGSAALSVLGRVPAADVRPVVRGRWIRTVDNKPVSWDEIYCCSNCREVRRYRWQFTNFCPNCGADMREGNDGT